VRGGTLSSARTPYSDGNEDLLGLQGSRLELRSPSLHPVSDSYSSSPTPRNSYPAKRKLIYKTLKHTY
jgi:hypothetical protein